MPESPLLLLLSVAAVFAIPAPARAQDNSAFILQQLPSLVDTYKDIHAHPELSHFEVRTSAIVAAELRKAGYTVTENVGVYADGSRAHGVVGILKNGPGPTLLVRADMDALPITEQTGVSYASHATGKTIDGQTTGIMHACGHDIHTTVLIGTARALAAQKSQWRGTLMLIGQPSEETIDGAKSMLADHLYERFGTPDMVIGLHDTNSLPAGKVGLVPGAAQASSSSIDVVIKGIGGHGAAPQAGRDPVTLAALYITQIQTIVSREEDPEDPTVVTVGDIHGGTKRNIIPDQVKLELTVRTFSDKSRQTVIDGLTQMAAGITTSAGLPPDRAATVTVLDEYAPLEFNDPALCARIRPVLIKTFGAENVPDGERVMPSEDVGYFGLEGHKIPVAYMRLGAMNPTLFAAAQAVGKELPGPHNSKFQPDPEPTISTGVRTMTAVAISLLQ